MTTIPEHDDSEPEYLILTRCSREALSKTAEERCEPDDDHLANDSDWEEDDGTVYDDYSGDEGIAYDETEASESSFGDNEYDEAIECEEEVETFETSTMRMERPSVLWPASVTIPVTRLMGVENTIKFQARNRRSRTTFDWDPQALGPKYSYVYYEDMHFLEIPAEVLYALLRHMINVFEASFHRFGHCHCGEDLKSEEWR